MSLYGLDESVRSQLRLERFSSADFSTKQFVEQLSRTQAGQGDGSLDPKPYIRTFEAVSGELQRLRDIAQHQEESAGQAVQQLSEARNLDMVDLAGNVDTCVAGVRALDERVAELGRAAGPLGDRLESLSRQHTQIVQARQLVTCYLSFLKRGQSPELTKLWSSTTPGDRRRCAHLVGQLQILARKIGNSTVEDHVDKFAEQLETAFVDAFQESYHVFDLSGMREIAEIANDFNGGTSIVQAYVNQHDFFMQVGKQVLDSDSSEAMWLELADALSDYPKFRTVIEQLVAEVSEVVVQETQVVVKVFPQPVQVLTVFLQRVFAQRIQGLVMRYLQEAESGTSQLVSVRVLYVCYSQIHSLAASLKDTWALPKFGLSVYSQSELASALDTSFADTFALFLDEYFQNETAALSQIVRATLQQPENGGAEDSNQGSPAPGTPGTPDGDRWTRAAARLRLRSSDSTPGTPPRTFNTNVTLETEAVQRVLAAFAESIAREQVLRPVARVSHDASEFYNLLVTELGGGYIDVALTTASEQARHQDSRNPPDYEFLGVVKTAGWSVRLLAAFVKTALMAMVAEHRDVAAEMSAKLNEYVFGVQDKCAILVEHAADLAASRVQHLLSKQRKRDFTDPVPPGEKGVCELVCEDMIALGKSASKTLDASNCHRLLVTVASQFAETWLAHVSRFTVSQAGGHALASDAAAYEHLMVQDWALSELAEQFATLRAIAKVFAVDASLLPSLLRDSHLANLRAATLRGYVSQRTDSGSLNRFY